MPIIKSISRKDSNFKQLLDYIHRHDGGEIGTFTYLHNILDVAPDDTEGMQRAFTINNAYRKKRKGGVGQYHEVISFHPDDAQAIQENPAILEDIARVYLELRASGAIAIARPHIDKEHVHIHCMISPNELESSKSIRLSKKQFQALQKTMQEYQLHYYPQLKNSYVERRDVDKYHRQEKEAPQRHTEQQMKKRGVATQRLDFLKKRVPELLSSVNQEGNMSAVFEQTGIEPYYYRNRLQGVWYEGKKYRFRRLLAPQSTEMMKLNRWNELRKKVVQQERKKEQRQGLFF